MPSTKLNRIENRKLLTKHTDPKLRRSLRIYLLVSLVVFIFMVISALRSGASFIAVLIGLIAGVLIGILFSRVYKISWNKDADHAIYKMDILGIVLLVIFIFFDLNRGNLVELFIHGESVGAASLALLAGAFYGRVLGSGRDIIKVLKEQEVFVKIPDNSAHALKT